MGTWRGRVLPLRVLSLVSVLLAGLAVAGCSKAPAGMSEEELLKNLLEAKHVGPFQFQRKVWPLLEKKRITYCGPLYDVKSAGTESLLVLNVDKQYAGEQLPWSLEGKSESPDLARSYKPGDAVCMTGTMESYTERNSSYRGNVKIASVEKSAAS
jgi:hypothetical protein